jgi:Tetracyclin repressor-like, C-terminal domain
MQPFSVRFRPAGCVRMAGPRGRELALADKELALITARARDTVATFLSPGYLEARVTLARLSPGDYPLIVQTAQAALSVSPDQEFRHGLAVVLDGLSVGLA